MKLATTGDYFLLAKTTLKFRKRNTGAWDFFHDKAPHADLEAHTKVRVVAQDHGKILSTKSASACCGFLAKMETPESLEIVKKMTHDSDKRVRDEALACLEERTEKPSKTLPTKERK